jgi:RHS repeat-associated protein
LTGVSNGYGETTTWTYDGEGKLTNQANANGTNTAYSYNQQRGWPTSIGNLRNGTYLSWFNLTYDNGQNTVGLLTGVNESAGSASYGYDALYRLTSESRTGSGANSHTHAYDLAGNRTNTDGFGYSFDDANKRIGFTYDSHGNTTQFSGPGVTNGYLTWDAFDQLTGTGPSASSALCKYGYNALGRRVYRWSAADGSANGFPHTFYVYDGDLLVAEIRGQVQSGWFTSYVSATYTWGAAGLVSERRFPSPTGQGTSYWYHYGPQGETRQLSNSSGTVVDTYLYTAYGVPVSTTGTDPNPFRYGGQFGYYTDTDPGNGGLILCGARWYSPPLARWLSRDPIGYSGGPSLYEYCAGDPVNQVDPSGLQEIDSINATINHAYARGGMQALREALGHAVSTVAKPLVPTYMISVARHPAVQRILQQATSRLPNVVQLTNRVLPNCDKFAERVAEKLEQNVGIEEELIQVIRIAPKNLPAGRLGWLPLKEGGAFYGSHTYVRWGDYVFDTLSGTRGELFNEWVKRFHWVNDGASFYKHFNVQILR